MSYSSLLFDVCSAAHWFMEGKERERGEVRERERGEGRGEEGKGLQASQCGMLATPLVQWDECTLAIIS